MPIDSLSFEYTIVNLDEKEIQAPPKEGVYIKVQGQGQAGGRAKGQSRPETCVHRNLLLL